MFNYIIVGIMSVSSALIFVNKLHVLLQSILQRAIHDGQVDNSHTYCQ